MGWKNGAVLVGNVCRELLLRTDAEVQRWPIEFKEKCGWRLIDPKEANVQKQPYFPHLFILCLHYGTNAGPLNCTLRLKKRNNPLYCLNNVKIGTAVEV